MVNETLCMGPKYNTVACLWFYICLPMETAEQMLRSAGLKVTRPRLRVVGHLMQCAQGHTLNELAQILNETCDRVTVYRTLKTLEQGEVVHSISDKGATRYKLTGGCSHEEEHEHIHFRCENCGDIMCIDETPSIPKLPGGYLLQKAELMLRGRCARCAHKSGKNT